MRGYLFAILGMLSIGAVGILSKLADRESCSSLATAVVLFGCSSGLMGFQIVAMHGSAFAPPRGIAWMALGFGVLAGLAFWVFLYGLQFGKITTSWVFLNLSAVLPAVASTILYKERIGPAKMLALGLVVAAILLLWKDTKESWKPRVGGRGTSAEARRGSS